MISMINFPLRWVDLLLRCKRPILLRQRESIHSIAQVCSKPNESVTLYRAPSVISWWNKAGRKSYASCHRCVAAAIEMRTMESPRKKVLRTLLTLDVTVVFHSRECAFSLFDLLSNLLPFDRVENPIALPYVRHGQESQDHWKCHGWIWIRSDCQNNYCRRWWKWGW